MCHIGAVSIVDESRHLATALIHETFSHIKHGGIASENEDIVASIVHCVCLCLGVALLSTSTRAEAMEKHGDVVVEKLGVEMALSACSSLIHALVGITNFVKDRRRIVLGMDCHCGSSQESDFHLSQFKGKSTRKIKK
jgi:hypothetical protein